MYSMKTIVQYPHPQCSSNLGPQTPQTQQYLAHIHKASIARPSTSMVVNPQGVRPQYQQHPSVQPQLRSNVSENEGETDRQLQEISQRLNSTTYALRSGEITVKMQAKEIEMLRKLNDELVKKNMELTVKAENASHDLFKKTKLIDEQNQKIADFKSKQDTLQKNNQELKDQIINLTFKLGEYQAKERTLKKQEEEMNRQLKEISQRLDTTTIGLKTEEHIARLQMKEIENLKKTIDQLNEKSLVLNADAQNALLALNDNSRLVQEQVLENADLKSKCYIFEKENEEWKSKYQDVLRSTEQDTYSMEQFGNALKNVLINNDIIIESLKGIQTDPEEKKELIVGRNETHRLLQEQEQLNVRVRELEEQMKENEDSDRVEYDFCDALNYSFFNR
ncbi:unnamed protein product [Caenorhabditis brenneri]